MLNVLTPSFFVQEFKRELYQKKIEIESQNHRFVCRLSPGSERPGSVSPLCDFRQRWDILESETVNRQVRKQDQVIICCALEYCDDIYFRRNTENNKSD